MDSFDAPPDAGSERSNAPDVCDFGSGCVEKAFAGWSVENLKVFTDCVSMWLASACRGPNYVSDC